MSNELDKWIQNAWNFQQDCHQQLGNRKWDRLDNHENLVNKLLYAFSVCYGNYDENKVTRKRTDRVIKEATKIFNEKNYNDYFACTFINLKLKDNDKEGSIFCVIWLGRADGTERCLDFSGRNYESWDDFLENNTLPKCHMIYPKSGRYYKKTELCANVVYSESIACSTKKIVKDVFDIVSVVGGAVATGVLVCNPVGASVLLGATAVSVASGVYSAGSSVNRLVDIHSHDGGLSLTETKTVLAVGELALSAVGTVAVGASAGIKGIATKTGTILSEGSAAYKLANNVGKISRVFSGVNAGFYVIVVVDNYNRHGCLGKNDLLYLSRALLFSLNVFVTGALLEKLVSFLADKCSIEQIIQFNVISPFMSCELVRNVYKFTSSEDLNKLIGKIFPDFHVYADKITKLKPIVDRVMIIADRTLEAMKNKRFDKKYVHFIQEQLAILMSEVNKYLKKNETDLQKRFDNRTCMIINKWIQNDGIELLVSNSRYESKINSPFEIQRTIMNTVNMCSKDTESSDMKAHRERFLLENFLKLVHLDSTKDSNYFVSKVSFYCKKFQCLHYKLVLLYHYQYFLFTKHHGSNCSKERFFRSEYNIHNIHDKLYQEAFDILQQNLVDFNMEFENNFPVDSTAKNDQQKKKTVFKFKMPNASDVKEDNFYVKAKELIPKLATQLNGSLTTLDRYGDVAIIKSNQDDFMLFFCTVVDKNCLNGILLLVEDICH